MRVSRKAAKLENPIKIFLKYPLWSIAAKLENVEIKRFLQIYKILSNFDSNPLICDATLFPGKNSPNIAKGNSVFPGKGRGDRALILTYLGSPVADVFPKYCLSFSISAIFKGKRVVKVGPKVQTLGPSLFYENTDPSNFFKQFFCLLEYYLCWEFRLYWTIFGEVRAQKPPKKDHFTNAESVRKTLKTFNFTTTNAILMKLTTIIYLHEGVNRKPLRARNFLP